MSSDGRGGSPSSGSSSGCGGGSGLTSSSSTVRMLPEARGGPPRGPPSPFDRGGGGRGLVLALVNGERAAGGAGVTPTVADELFRSGVDVLSSGNNVWRKKEALDLLKLDHRVLRPLD